jgi:3-oxoadipate enol-lactonase
VPTERWIDRAGFRLFARQDGAADPKAPTIVFANALGTATHLWDALLPHLPATLRLIRWDLRGHGQSDAPPAPYAMGALISDAEAVCTAFDVRDAVFVGLSLGGLIAQGLAVKRLDQMRALVLSSTAAKLETPAKWEERIVLLHDGGLSAVAAVTLDRWFPRSLQSTPAVEAIRDQIRATSPQGYEGCCAAIAGTDFYSTTATLRLPTLAIAGSEDRATPPDLMRETADLVPGSRFVLMRRSGHLPCVDNPAGYADHLTTFLKEIGHV